MSTSLEPTMTKPSIRLEMPPGWFYKESYTVLHPDGRANVIVSSEPLSETMSITEYTDVQRDLLKEFPGFDERGFEQIDIDGVPGEAWLREFTWTPEGRSPVTQLQVYALLEGRGYTATATTPSEDMDELRNVLTDVLYSVVVEATS
ncbi:MAG: hypothetical protein QOF58_7337 [Pseudonocardiales bacterium]|jgi:hypothetical protein|nr:hypothetical protein [Pseudonocardiales bacterium]